MKKKTHSHECPCCACEHSHKKGHKHEDERGHKHSHKHHHDEDNIGGITCGCCSSESETQGVWGRLMTFLAGWWITAVSGIFIVASLCLKVAFKDRGVAYPDPAIVSVILSGLPLLDLAVKRLIKNKGISKISSALLISVAMIASVIIGDLFAAAEVAFIMAIGALLEDMSTRRARKGLRKLISIAPTMARRVVNDIEESVHIEEILVGDIIRVLPGETIPVDGCVINGESSVDQSVMTGESLPVDKTIGDSVFCGTQNRFGSVDIRATKIGEDSSLEKLIRLVREAEEKKAPMQRIADKWASLLVPVAFVLAVIAGLLRSDPVVAVTVLVVFCPCALVLATPTAIMAAIGQATRNGVIIKSGAALEKMGRVNAIAFDKTGTLTHGMLAVADVLPLRDGVDRDELLAMAASVESRSEHPLGRAVYRYGREALEGLPSSEGFFMYAGKGVEAIVNGKRVFCGKKDFLEEIGVPIDRTTSECLENAIQNGKATVIVADKDGVLGVIALSDTVRDDSKKILAELKKMGVKTVLLTGDRGESARSIGELIGVEEICYELLPHQKVEKIQDMQKDGASICMVGDGVNDAPALKCADIGVAMGEMGSDIAVESADIALMSDDISRLPYLVKLARATARTIKFSISLSLLINFAAILLSFFELLNPTTGALVHNAGSCFVVLVATFLYDRKF